MEAALAEVVAWEGGVSPDPAELRCRLESDGFDVLSWEDAPGTVYEPHVHDHDELLWLFAGEMTFGIDGRELRLCPGDRLRLPRGTVHSAVAGDEGASYFVGQRRA